MHARCGQDARAPGYFIVSRCASAPRGCEAQLIRDAAHGFNAEGDVFVKRHAQFLGALDNILTAHGAGKGFVFHPLADRFGLEGGDPVGPHQGAGGNEPGKFVAREKDFGQKSVARYAGIFGVAENGAPDFLRDAFFFQDLASHQRVVRRVRIDLVIEVVDQAHNAPLFVVLAELPGIGANARLDGQRMLPQVLVLGVLTEKVPGLLAIHLVSLPLQAEVIPYRIYLKSA
ncbi:hypothetical protein SBA2_740026 [Acidobacteriia bacterium SbA2]|nr:hypothetical protein SBA2_740026 [Acidobacteriia bacterium SbA2]